MPPFKYSVGAAAMAVGLAACGGGGGGGGGTMAPTVSLTANPTSVAAGGQSTLKWSSSNATSCSASGGWSGSEPTSGSLAVTPANSTTYTLTCTGAGGSGNAAVAVAVASSGSAGNVVPIIVDSGPAGGPGFANTLFTAVTICAPGSTSNCQTIDHIQVDTGSSGVRILAAALNAGLASLPVNAASDGNSLLECAQFGDGYAWGPVVTADVSVGGEKAGGIAVQIIGDARFPTVPSACANTGMAEDSLAKFGANGIIGINAIAQDCGGACAASGSPGFYYSCSASQCKTIAVPLAAQLLNPVTLFAADNNGIIVALPAVVAAGAATVTGTLTFGVDTAMNNASGSQTVYALDSVNGYLTTSFNGQSQSDDSLFDTGSNALYFNDSNIPQCGNQAPGFYCPSTTLNLTASVQGLNNASGNLAFSIGNFVNELNAQPTYYAFPDVGATLPSSINFAPNFIWGLPYFYGKSIYFVFAGAKSSAATGPYVAF